MYARIGPIFFLISLSAYSTTIIAPSTSIPTANIKPNITILDIDILKIANNANVSMKDIGIAKPTNNADLVPNEAKTTIITSAIAVKTADSRESTMPFTCLELSNEKSTTRFFCRRTGHVSLYSFTTFLTSLTV